MIKQVFTLSQNNGDGSFSTKIFDNEEDLINSVKPTDYDLDHPDSWTSMELGYRDTIFIDYEIVDGELKFKPFSIYVEQ